MKAIESYFPVLLFTLLCKEVQTFNLSKCVHLRNFLFNDLQERNLVVFFFFCFYMYVLHEAVKK